MRQDGVVWCIGIEEFRQLVSLAIQEPHAERGISTRTSAYQAISRRERGQNGPYIILFNERAMNSWQNITDHYRECIVLSFNLVEEECLELLFPLTDSQG